MSKDKIKPIRCLMDATDLPPSAFALPDDGRKKNHLCLKRKMLCVVIARRANHDGTCAYPSKKTMREATGFPERTVGRLLNDLHKLGILIEGDIHKYYRTRIWTVRLPETEPDSGSQNAKTEPDRIGSEPDRTVTEPDRSPESTGSRLGGSHTALSLPPSIPPSHQESASENLNSYSQLARWLPDDMKAAQKRRGEKEQIDALISMHGGAKFLAALKHHWVMQDPESKLSCKWTAFLENFEGWLAKVTPAELKEQAHERWRKEHPEEWKRIQDESIERQVQENMRRKLDRPQVAECSIEELMEE